jgi:hypothetical protein
MLLLRTTVDRGDDNTLLAPLLPNTFFAIIVKGCFVPKPSSFRGDLSFKHSSIIEAAAPTPFNQGVLIRTPTTSSALILQLLWSICKMRAIRRESL